MTDMKQRVGRILTPDQAGEAVYFDFECVTGDAPSVLGWAWLDPDSGEVRFEQRVVESGLWPAYPRRIPMTGRPNTRWQPADLDIALAELADLLESDDRLLVSWSKFDAEQIRHCCADELLVERLESRYRNALPTAKQWLGLCRPGVQLEKKRWGGKNSLSAYCGLHGFSVPKKYGENVAAKGIRAMRVALKKSQHGSKLPSAVTEKWKALIGHNYLDCRNALYVVCFSALDLENTM